MRCHDQIEECWLLKLTLLEACVKSQSFRIQGKECQADGWRENRALNVQNLSSPNRRYQANVRTSLEYCKRRCTYHDFSTESILNVEASFLYTSTDWSPLLSH